MVWLAYRPPPLSGAHMVTFREAYLIKIIIAAVVEIVIIRDISTVCVPP